MPTNCGIRRNAKYTKSTFYQLMCIILFDCAPLIMGKILNKALALNTEPIQYKVLIYLQSFGCSFWGLGVVLNESPHTNSQYLSIQTFVPSATICPVANVQLRLTNHDSSFLGSGVDVWESGGGLAVRKQFVTAKLLTNDVEID